MPRQFPQIPNFINVFQEKIPSDLIRVYKLHAVTPLSVVYSIPLVKGDDCVEDCHLYSTYISSGHASGLSIR